MKICLDISSLGAPRDRWTGVARVAWEMMQELERHPSVQLQYSASGSYFAQSLVAELLSELGKSDKSVIPREKPLQGILKNYTSSERSGVVVSGADVLLRVMHRLFTPLDLGQLHDTDFYFSTFARIPVCLRKLPRIRCGIFIHDVIPLLFPQYCRPVQIPILKRILRSITDEDIVAVNSVCTKLDLCRCFAIDPGQVFVVPLAADARIFYPVRDEEKLAAIRVHLGIKEDRYFLSLHSMAPHKNMRFLIEAYRAYRDSAGKNAIPLVIAGGKDVSGRHLATALNLTQRQLEGVQFLGFVADKHLAGLFSGANAFFFPSLYEGFGLPVLEAMFCGTPVFVSNRGSLPEVVLDQSSLLDPNDKEVWVGAFKEAEDIASLSKTAVNSLTDVYSWSKTADRLVEVLNRT